MFEHNGGTPTRRCWRRWATGLARVRELASRANFVPVVGAGLLLAVLYWPLWPLVPSQGLDESFKVGLTWAHELGLHWGPDVLFTWGPLFFLDNPLASSRLAVTAASAVWILYALIVTLAAYAAFEHHRISGNMRLLAAAATSALLLTMPSSGGLTGMHVLVPMTIVLTMLAAVRRTLLVAVLAGIAVGMLGTHKLSDAIMAGALSVLCLTATLGIPGLVRFSAGAAISFVASWLLAGQSLVDLLVYVPGAYQIVRGFGPAMNTMDPGYVWHYPLAIALALAVVWCGWTLTEEPSRLRRFGFVAGIGAGLWIAARQAFTRHDVGHYWYFFGIVVLICIAFAILATDRRMARVAALTGLVAYLVVATTRVGPFVVLDRQASLNALDRTLGIIASRDEAQELLSVARLKLLSDYAITPEILDRVSDSPTIVDPVDISALYAAAGVVTARWDPLPIIQNYSAYTPELDAINARSLRERPRQILRSVQYVTIDGRNPYWDAPAYQRLVYCSYEVVLATEAWQVIRPAATRCGQAQEGTTEDAAADQDVQVPSRTGAITLVTIAPIRSVAEQAVDFVIKPQPFFVTYGETRWRLASSPVAAELMLNTPEPHPAFANLPRTPYPTIAVTTPARVSFAFIDVVQRVSSVDAPSVDRTPILPPGDAGSIVTGTRNVAASLTEDRCLLLDATGTDPQVELRTGTGITIEVSSLTHGLGQVFLNQNGTYAEENSFQFDMSAGSWSRILLPGGLVRFDPPDEGATLLCQVGAS